jgi:hypothetical protein
LGPGRTPRWRQRQVVAVIAATVEIATEAVAAAIVVVTVVGAASVPVARHGPVAHVDRLRLAPGGHGQALRVRDRARRARHERRLPRRRPEMKRQ